MLFGKIALVGVGLLGGSLAMAIRERKLAGVVSGYVRRDATITECDQAGLTQFATRDLLSAVSDADIVILCTPLGQMRELAERFAPALKTGAIVTDIGSVKASVVAELDPIIRKAGAQFIGAHPMAGAEKTGVNAARPDLFQNAVCVITPSPRANPFAVRRLEEFWRAVGSRVTTTTPTLHDELVARCSHLPHLIAAQLATFILDPQHPKEQPLLCATGFRDTTRIASGSPEMWRDIAMANREQVTHALDKFLQDLQQLRATIADGDSTKIEAFFTAAKQRRDAWCSQTAAASPE